VLVAGVVGTVVLLADGVPEVLSVGETVGLDEFTVAWLMVPSVASSPQATTPAQHSKASPKAARRVLPPN